MSRQQILLVHGEDFIDLENGYILQRLNKDFLWYVLKDNRIIDYSKHRHDLIEAYKEK